jgi:hypothetical protein
LKTCFNYWTNWHITDPDEEEQKMKIAKTLSVSSFLAIGLALMISGTVFAGAGPEPPAGATITGPEIWGVVVLNCNGGTATLRVKRVVDCNTQTSAGIVTNWPVTTSNCPTQASQVEGFSIGQSFFGIPGTAFINKAKNFNKEGNIVSFDAQFKFFQ